MDLLRGFLLFCGFGWFLGFCFWWFAEFVRFVFLLHFVDLVLWFCWFG